MSAREEFVSRHVDGINELLDDDEIDGAEAGFLYGYDEEVDV